MMTVFSQSRQHRMVNAGGGGFTPASVSGLAMWLKADAGLYSADTGGSLVTTDGTAVGRWEDQSGNGNHVIQATSGNRPVLKTSIVNGQPVVRFDNTASQWLGKTGVSWSQPLTVFYVCSTVANRDSNGVIGGSAASQLISYYYTGQGWDLFAGTSLQNNTNFAPFAAKLFTFQANGASSYKRANAAAVQSGDPGSSGITNLEVGRIWGSNYLGGDIATLLVYTAAISSTDRDSVEGYLNGIYAIY